MTRPESPGAKLLRNSALNIAAFGVSLLVAALLVPLVVDRIGISDFGRAGLVIACFAPLQLVGTVLGQSVARELASTGNRDPSGAGRMLAAALTLCSVAVVTVLLLLVAAWVVWGHSAGGAPTPVGMTVLLLTFCAGWAFQQYALVLQAVAVSAQNYQDVAIVTLLGALASAACVVLGVSVLPNHVGYLAGLSAGYLTTCLLWTGMLQVRYRRARALSRFGRDELSRILAFGKWQSVTQVAGTMGNQMDRYCLGALTTVATVGRYNIAMRVQEVVYMAVLKAAEVLFPYFASLDARDERRQLQVLATGCFALNTLAACLIAPLIVLAEPLVNLWVGSAGTEGAAHMLVTLAAAGIVGSSVNVYVCWAMGTGNNSGLALMSIAGAVVTIVLTLVLISRYGETAAGLGVLGGAIAMQAVALWNLRRRFDLAAPFRTLLACGWPPLLAGLGLALMIRRMHWPAVESWPALFASYALLALLVVLGGVLATGVSAPGRGAIGSALAVAGRVARRAA